MAGAVPALVWAPDLPGARAQGDARVLGRVPDGVRARDAGRALDDARGLAPEWASAAAGEPAPVQVQDGARVPDAARVPDGAQVRDRAWDDGRELAAVPELARARDGARVPDDAQELGPERASEAVGVRASGDAAVQLGVARGHWASGPGQGFSALAPGSSASPSVWRPPPFRRVPWPARRSWGRNRWVSRSRPRRVCRG
jgi:hypothetical protein